MPPLFPNSGSAPADCNMISHNYSSLHCVNNPNDHSHAEKDSNDHSHVKKDSSNRVDVKKDSDNHGRVKMNPDDHNHVKKESSNRRHAKKDSSNHVDVKKDTDDHGRVKVNPNDHSHVKKESSNHRHAKKDSSNCVDVKEDSDDHGHIKMNPDDYSHAEEDSNNHSHVKKDSSNRVDVKKDSDSHGRVKMNPNDHSHAKKESDNHTCVKKDSSYRLDVKKDSDGNGHVKMNPTDHSHAKKDFNDHSQAEKSSIDHCHVTKDSSNCHHVVKKESDGHSHVNPNDHSCAKKDSSSFRHVKKDSDDHGRVKMNPNDLSCTKPNSNNHSCIKNSDDHCHVKMHSSNCVHISNDSDNPSHKNDSVAADFNSDHSDVKEDLLVSSQKSIDPTDCQIISDDEITDLNSIKLPPKIKKRGRPKGADLTVIGLPRKKKCTMKPIKVLKKPCLERDKQILSWMLPDELVKKALSGEKIGQKEIISDVQLSLSLLDENVNWVSVQQFFTKAVWVKVADMIAELEKNPQWKCGVCHKDISLTPSIVCESCLVWYHIKCSGLNVAPKKAEWFCQLCYATCSTDVLRNNESNGIKVNFCIWHNSNLVYVKLGLYIMMFFFVYCRMLHQYHKMGNTKGIQQSRLGDGKEKCSRALLIDMMWFKDLNIWFMTLKLVRSLEMITLMPSISYCMINSKISRACPHLYWV